MELRILSIQILIALMIISCTFGYPQKSKTEEPQKDAKHNDEKASNHSVPASEPAHSSHATKAPTTGTTIAIKALKEDEAGKKANSSESKSMDPKSSEELRTKRQAPPSGSAPPSGGLPPPPSGTGIPPSLPAPSSSNSIPPFPTNALASGAVAASVAPTVLTASVPAAAASAATSSALQPVKFPNPPSG